MKVTDGYAGLPSHRFILVRFLLCFYSGTSVSAEIDEAVLEDGTKIQPVSVLFPEGSSVPAPPQSEVLAQHPGRRPSNVH